jgi:ribosomal protein L37E
MLRLKFTAAAAAAAASGIARGGSGAGRHPVRCPGSPCDLVGRKREPEKEREREIKRSTESERARKAEKLKEQGRKSWAVARRRCSLCLFPRPLLRTKRETE